MPFAAIPNMSMPPLGSVHLIGEHTDYCEDFVPIPMAFPMIIVMVARALHYDSDVCFALEAATVAPWKSLRLPYEWP